MSFSPAEINEFKDAFGLFDKKGDGCISSKELGTVLRALNQNPSKDTVDKIQHEIDPDNSDKRVSFEEFLPILSRVQKDRPAGKQQDYIEGLRVFDKDGNGTINAADLRHILTTLGEKLTDDEVDALLQNINVDSAGYVYYEEFVKLVMSNGN